MAKKIKQVVKKKSHKVVYSPEIAAIKKSIEGLREQKNEIDKQIDRRVRLCEALLHIEIKQRGIVRLKKAL